MSEYEASPNEVVTAKKVNTLCVRPLRDVQMMDQIEGFNGEECPWEAGNFTAASKIQLGIFRHDILKLLQRDARERPSMGQFSDMCNRILAGTATQEGSEPKFNRNDKYQSRTTTT